MSKYYFKFRTNENATIPGEEFFVYARDIKQCYFIMQGYCIEANEVDFLYYKQEIEPQDLGLDVY